MPSPNLHRRSSASKDDCHDARRTNSSSASHALLAASRSVNNQTTPEQNLRSRDKTFNWSQFLPGFASPMASGAGSRREDAEQQCKDLEGQVSHLRNELSKAKTQNKEHSRDFQSLVKQHKELQFSSHVKSNQLEHATRHIKHQEQHIAELKVGQQQVIAEMKEDRHRAHLAIQDEQVESRKLQQQIMRYKQEIAASGRLGMQMSDDVIQSKMNTFFFGLQDWVLNSMRATSPSRCLHAHSDTLGSANYA